MILQNNRFLATLELLILILLVLINIHIDHVFSAMRNVRTTRGTMKGICASNDHSIRAKRKSCLLWPDSGPCRADILSYYYDARQKRCYRFFYGGCQGNGNNFKTRSECIDTCFLPAGPVGSQHVPYFCSLPFDFGNCFGQYNRWTWDRTAGHCKPRLYSGCGGNQNNFQTKAECMNTCFGKPNNTLTDFSRQFTTCIPVTIPDFH